MSFWIGIQKPKWLFYRGLYMPKWNFTEAWESHSDNLHRPWKFTELWKDMLAFNRSPKQSTLTEALKSQSGSLESFEMPAWHFTKGLKNKQKVTVTCCRGLEKPKCHFKSQTDILPKALKTKQKVTVTCCREALTTLAVVHTVHAQNLWAYNQSRQISPHLLLNKNASPPNQ